MRTAMFAAIKGGVGKTLCADEFAFSLDRTNTPYVFIDLDRQGGTTHTGIEEGAAHASHLDDDAEVAIIDTPATMPDDVLETLEDLSDDDLVVIVTRATSKDVAPFGRAVEVVRAHTNAKIAYVVNQTDRYSMAKQFTEWFKEGVKYNNAAFIRASEKVRQAEALRKSIFEHDKRRECVATPGMQEMVQMVRRNLGLPADNTI